MTNVSPIAAVVDDTGTTTVAEDAYGAPRMTGVNEIRRLIAAASTSERR